MKTLLCACCFGLFVVTLYLAQIVVSEFAKANSFAAARLSKLDGQ